MFFSAHHRIASLVFAPLVLMSALMSTASAQSSKFISSRPDPSTGLPITDNIPVWVYKDSIVLRGDDPLFPAETRSRTCHEYFGPPAPEVTYIGGPVKDIRFETKDGVFTNWQREKDSPTCIRRHTYSRVTNACPAGWSGSVKEQREYDVLEDDSIINDTGWKVSSRLCLQTQAADTVVNGNGAGSRLIGTIGDNYWHTGYYERYFKILIDDPQDLEYFYIGTAGFDDHLFFAINSNWIYNHSGGINYTFLDYNPQGSNTVWNDGSGGFEWGNFKPAILTPSGRWGWPIYNKKCLRHQWTDDEYGGRYKTCVKVSDEPPALVGWNYLFERNTNWHVNLGMSLIPYLKKGENILRVDTIAVDLGEFWAWLHFKMK